MRKIFILLFELEEFYKNLRLELFKNIEHHTVYENKKFQKNKYATSLTNLMEKILSGKITDKNRITADLNSVLTKKKESPYIHSHYHR